ncbi:hypothetical protein FGG08_004210 [Glutinoglossum americanum]|uniref:LYC1 C-terminal domain-containing protein n=1 Tax=Glutinoglossum americanum TaxID=1670608 RepID=A0A9P8I2S3_9PEZI|nr:hypothetical protein FGG08_004210 [Glutinoglossum americanum]
MSSGYYGVLIDPSYFKNFIFNCKQQPEIMPPPSAVIPSSVVDITFTHQLPNAESPTLRLVHPTFAEKQTIWKQNAYSWRGALSIPAYLRREQHLSETSLTRNGGITHWVLVDTSQPFEDERRVLASCETIRKRALVAFQSPEGVEVEEVVSHGIGSVFCPKEFRGRGYAKRMMQELSGILRVWGTEKAIKGSKNCLFTVLYSDIGKKFYASHGWHPFASSHISLPPIPKDYVGKAFTLPPPRELYAASLRELCDIDEHHQIQRLATLSSKNKVHVAFVPDLKSMEYHHAREEYIAREVIGPEPNVKGAIVGDSDGQRAWCIWTHVFDGKDESNPATTLYILRLVIEDEEVVNQTGLVNPNGPLAADDGLSEAKSKRVDVVASLLLAARQEAGRWGMKDVKIWNPGPTTLVAAHRALNLTSEATETSVIEVVDREKESIPSLMWYGESRRPGLEGIEWKGVEWVCNERYAWC